MTHCAGELGPSRASKRAYVYRARFIGGNKKFPQMASQIYPNNHSISSSHNRIGSCRTFLTSSLRSCFALLALGLVFGGCATLDPQAVTACGSYVFENFVFGSYLKIAKERAERFLGKVQENTARCRGADKAVKGRDLPWVDWQNYWATGDASSLAYGAADGSGHLLPNGRGIDGALIDLEYQRMEMIKFNLFDNTGTYEQYTNGREEKGEQQPGPTLKTWDTMKLREGYREYSWLKKGWIPVYETVGGEGKQTCRDELIRFRTITGICNDIINPLMGSTGQPFARNVEFEATFPEDATLDSSDSEKRKVVRYRHGSRLDTLKPDPQVISRKLFARESDDCSWLAGYFAIAKCDYKRAPHFNVLAAFWIQFMTHDWFSHLKDGHNREVEVNGKPELVNGKPDLMSVGCGTQALGCRPDDQIDRAYVTKAGKTFTNDKTRLAQAYKTTNNYVTAWWDASQIYGYDQNSFSRVKRELIQDPQDPTKKKFGAKLRLDKGYLPPFEDGDPKNPVWAGQEATAFPDNWSIGLSFFHNVFAREHNRFVEFVDEFRKWKPDDDSGLRNPTNPDVVIHYGEITDDELFEIGRLVVAAEIAKIHTTEWTTQLLYNEPLYLGMNANWHGLGQKSDAVSKALMKVVETLGKSDDPKKANQLYSAFAAGPGIFGWGNRNPDCLLIWFFCKDTWSLSKLEEDVNGGVNHFGSPFNFPEEFVTVYRLHPMVPDLIEYRELGKDKDAKDNDPNVIKQKIPVVATFRGKATKWMRDNGLANWGLSMGRQPLGRLTLQNHPKFLQNLPMDRFPTKTGKIDVAALDLIRDRERGVPRFNEFRRQYGLKPLTSFNDFINKNLNEQDPEEKAELERQRDVVKTLKEVYGWHYCDEKKKPISTAQKDDDPENNDCLGPKERLEDGKVDNIEDLDTVVGWLAEPVRPHGFAISETQFQVFILNASRRLFSDRFFTSSFRPEFYTHIGVEWVTNNGPDCKKIEPDKSNGHKVEVSPLNCVLQRTIPELATELAHVVNVFDVWGRNRGEYYSLQPPPERKVAQ